MQSGTLADAILQRVRQDAATRLPSDVDATDIVKAVVERCVGLALGRTQAVDASKPASTRTNLQNVLSVSALMTRAYYDAFIGVPLGVPCAHPRWPLVAWLEPVLLSSADACPPQKQVSASQSSITVATDASLPRGSGLCLTDGSRRLHCITANTHPACVGSLLLVTSWSLALDKYHIVLLQSPSVLLHVHEIRTAITTALVGHPKAPLACAPAPITALCGVIQHVSCALHYGGRALLLMVLQGCECTSEAVEHACSPRTLMLCIQGAAAVAPYRWLCEPGQGVCVQGVQRVDVTQAADIAAAAAGACIDLSVCVHVYTNIGASAFASFEKRGSPRLEGGGAGPHENASEHRRATPDSLTFVMLAHRDCGHVHTPGVHAETSRCVPASRVMYTGRLSTDPITHVAVMDGDPRTSLLLARSVTQASPGLTCMSVWPPGCMTMSAVTRVHDAEPFIVRGSIVGLQVHPHTCMRLASIYSVRISDHSRAYVHAHGAGSASSVNTHVRLLTCRCSHSEVHACVCDTTFLCRVSRTWPVDALQAWVMQARSTVCRCADSCAVVSRIAQVHAHTCVSSDTPPRILSAAHVHAFISAIAAVAAHEYAHGSSEWPLPYAPMLIDDEGGTIRARRAVRHALQMWLLALAQECRVEVRVLGHMLRITVCPPAAYVVCHTHCSAFSGALMCDNCSGGHVALPIMGASNVVIGTALPIAWFRLHAVQVDLFTPQPHTRTHPTAQLSHDVRSQAAVFSAQRVLAPDPIAQSSPACPNVGSASASKDASLSQLLQPWSFVGNHRAVLLAAPVMKDSTAAPAGAAAVPLTSVICMCVSASWRCLEATSAGLAVTALAFHAESRACLGVVLLPHKCTPAGAAAACVCDTSDVNAGTWFRVTFKDATEAARMAALVSHVDTHKRMHSAPFLLPLQRVHALLPLVDAERDAWVGMTVPPAAALDAIFKQHAACRHLREMMFMVRDAVASYSAVWTPAWQRRDQPRTADLRPVFTVCGTVVHILAVDADDVRRQPVNGALQACALGVPVRKLRVRLQNVSCTDTLDDDCIDVYIDMSHACAGGSIVPPALLSGAGAVVVVSSVQRNVTAAQKVYLEATRATVIDVIPAHAWPQYSCVRACIGQVLGDICGARASPPFTLAAWQQNTLLDLRRVCMRCRVTQCVWLRLAWMEPRTAKSLVPLHHYAHALGAHTVSQDGMLGCDFVVYDVCGVKMVPDAAVQGVQPCAVMYGPEATWPEDYRRFLAATSRITSTRAGPVRGDALLRLEGTLVGDDGTGEARLHACDTYVVSDVQHPPRAFPRGCAMRLLRMQRERLVYWGRVAAQLGACVADGTFASSAAMHAFHDTWTARRVASASMITTALREYVRRGEVDELQAEREECDEQRESPPALAFTPSAVHADAVSFWRGLVMPDVSTAAAFMNAEVAATVSGAATSYAPIPTRDGAAATYGSTAIIRSQGMAWDVVLEPFYIRKGSGEDAAARAHAAAAAFAAATREAVRACGVSVHAETHGDELLPYPAGAVAPPAPASTTRLWIESTSIASASLPTPHFKVLRVHSVPVHQIAAAAAADLREILGAGLEEQTV